MNQVGITLIINMLFNYKAFYDWHQVHFEDSSICDVNTDAIVITYNPAFKYAGSGKKLRFKVCELQKVAKFLPIQDEQEYPNGMFIVADYKNKLADMWLLFVFPKPKYMNGQLIDGLFADHFSFCYNKDNKKKPVNFHTTEYNPRTYDGSEGVCVHDIVKSVDDVEVSTLFKKYENLPFYDAATRIASLPLQKGGGNEMSKPTRDIYDSGKYFQNKTFNRAFNDFKLSSIIVFGIGKNYSVYTYDTKYTERPNNMNVTNAHAFSFRLDIPYEKADLEKEIRKRVIEYFRSKF